MKLYNFYIGSGQGDKKGTNGLSPSGPEPKEGDKGTTVSAPPFMGGRSCPLPKRRGFARPPWEMRKGQK